MNNLWETSFEQARQDTRNVNKEKHVLFNKQKLVRMIPPDCLQTKFDSSSFAHDDLLHCKQHDHHVGQKNACPKILTAVTSKRRTKNCL